MNLQTIKKVMPILLKNKIVPFLHGGPGVGKTQIVKSIGDEHFDGTITLNLASQDVGDLIGLLDKDAQNKGAVKHLRPNWFPTEGRWLIFLDEINRAQRDVIQPMYTFLQTGKLHTHQLPEGCRLVAAGNYSNDNFITTDITDHAFLDRFVHIDVQPNNKEWIEWSKSKKGMPSVMANFFLDRPEMAADDFGSFDFSLVKKTRRAWDEMVIPFFTTEKDVLTEPELKELMFGMVGTAATASFFEYLESNKSLPEVDELLSNYSEYKELVVSMGSPNAKGVTRVDSLTDATAKIVEKMASVFVDQRTGKNVDFTKEQIHAIQDFAMDIPKEVGIELFKKMPMFPTTNMIEYMHNNLRPEFEAFLSEFTQILTEKTNKKEAVNE